MADAPKPHHCLTCGKWIPEWAALEQEREKYRKQLRYWTGQHERIEQTCLRLQDTNDRLREAIREIADCDCCSCSKCADVLDQFRPPSRTLTEEEN